MKSWCIYRNEEWRGEEGCSKRRRRMMEGRWEKRGDETDSEMWRK